MAEFENETMTLVAEFMEGMIEPQRFARLNALLTESSEARTIYFDMIALRTGLEILFRQDPKESDIFTQLRLQCQEAQDKKPEKGISTFPASSVRPE